MTLIVTILTVCLVLALVAGVVETCIASWMIRRYKGAKDNESLSNAAAERAERRHQAAVEALEEINLVFEELCENTVTTLLMPSRATLIRTCKSSAKTVEKAKAKAILSTLDVIRLTINDPESIEWIEALMEEMETIVGEEL